MKYLRYALQFIFIIAHLIGLLVILVYVGAFENYVAQEAVDEYILYVPNAFLTVMVTLIAVFLAPDSRLALFAFLIPMLPIVGCLIRGRSRWIYRILVYPILLLSMLTSFMDKGTSTRILISATYLGIGIVIDALQ